MRVLLNPRGVPPESAHPSVFERTYEFGRAPVVGETVVFGGMRLTVENVDWSQPPGQPEFIAIVYAAHPDAPKRRSLS